MKERDQPKKYLDWANAGGPNECAHGYAADIACPSCYRDEAAAESLPSADLTEQLAADVRNGFICAEWQQQSKAPKPATPSEPPAVIGDLAGDLDYQWPTPPAAERTIAELERNKNEDPKASDISNYLIPDLEDCL